MSRNAFRFIFLAVIFISTASAVRSDVDDKTRIGSETKNGKHLLRYRFHQGESLRWNVLQSLNMETAMRGKREILETSSRSTKVWTVLDVDAEGTAIFEYKVEDVDMRRSQTGMEDAAYDSRKDETVPPGFNNLEGMIGVPLAHWTIDSRGETKKKVALTEYSGGARENRIAIPLPEEPVAEGDYWYLETPIEIPRPDGTVKHVKARQRFTLERVRSDIAKIKFVTQTLTVLTPTEESQILDKYASGSLELDLRAGHVVSQETVVDKRVVDFQGAGSVIHHRSRFTECCCGRKSCELCSRNAKDD